MVVMTLVSLGFSLVMLVVFLDMTRRQQRFELVSVFSLLGGFVALVLFLPAALLQMVATFVVALFCVVAQPRRSVVVGLLVAPLVLGYALALYYPLARLHELNIMRQQFPQQSLADRLDYEHAAAVTQAPAPVDLSLAVEVRLASFEERELWSHRRQMLAALHNRSREDFILATGFGPSRMIQVSLEGLVMDEPAPVSLSDALPGEMDGYPGEPAGERPQAAMPDLPLLKSLHNSGLDDLFHPDRMGVGPDKEHVAGFSSHRFTRVPAAANNPLRHWQLTRMELIGLLKYDRPKAYVSEHLPRLDELGEDATREVNAFEQSALGRLQSDEDLVIDENPERLRMVGSLRAAKDCLACHDVRRGQLIGALTYEIVPLTLPRAPLGDQARLDAVVHGPAQ